MRPDALTNSGQREQEVSPALTLGERELCRLGFMWEFDSPTRTCAKSRDEGSPDERLQSVPLTLEGGAAQGP